MHSKPRVKLQPKKLKIPPVVFMIKEIYNEAAEKLHSEKEHKGYPYAPMEIGINRNAFHSIK